MHTNGIFGPKTNIFDPKLIWRAIQKIEFLTRIWSGWNDGTWSYLVHYRLKNLDFSNKKIFQSFRLTCLISIHMQFSNPCWISRFSLDVTESRKPWSQVISKGFADEADGLG